MIDVTDIVQIDRPSHEVFAFVADQTNAPRWQHTWLLVLGSAQEGHVRSGGQSKAARVLGRLLLGGMATAGGALLLSPGSALQKVGLCAGIALGAGGFLGYPLWQMRVSRHIGEARGGNGSRPADALRSAAP